MKRFFGFLAAVSLGLWSCNDDNSEELNFNDAAFTVEEIALIYQEALSQFEFNCDHSNISTTSSYFTGKINGNEVCYISDDVRYREIYYRVPTVAFLGPKPFNGNSASVAAYQFGISAVDYEDLTDDRIRIQTPVFPKSTLEKDIVENSLQLTFMGQVEKSVQTGELPLASNKVSLVEGFDINIEFSYDSKLDDQGPYADYLHTITLQTAFGDQEDSRLEIVDIKKTEDDTAITYNFSLGIDCKLYWPKGQEMVYFGKLENGMLKTRIVVDK